METHEIIELSNAEISQERACVIHPGVPLHIVTECSKLAGVQPYNKRVACSICDQDWGQGAVSQHESCATLFQDGSRTYAHPVVYVRRNDSLVEVRTAHR